MKKKRGQRRYFRSLEFKQIEIPQIWIDDGFFSYEKIWIDDYGFEGFKKRKPHLDCLFRNFDRLAVQMNGLNMPFQIWIWINEKDARDTCIFLHSQNPLTTFPHKYKNLSQICNFGNSELANYINREQGFNKLFGTSFFEDNNGRPIKENFCVLYKDNVGESVI